MAEKIPAPTGGELNPMAFQDWNQDSELKVKLPQKNVWGQRVLPTL